MQCFVAFVWVHPQARAFFIALKQAVSDASEGGENAHIVPVPVQEGVPEHNVEEMKAFFVR